jgi:single-stranded-DNA-specific exonuclease
MQRRWIFPAASDAASLLRVRHEADVPDFLAELLLKRGVSDGISAEAYLKPRLRSLRAPEQLPEVEVAVARILAAMDRREKVVLYGDYDVDGITSLAILARFLKPMGSRSRAFCPCAPRRGMVSARQGLSVAWKCTRRNCCWRWIAERLQ